MLHFRSVFGLLDTRPLFFFLSYFTIFECAFILCAGKWWMCMLYVVLIIKTPINDISRFQKPRFAHLKYIITSHCCAVCSERVYRYRIFILYSRLQTDWECWNFRDIRTLACASVNYTKIKYKNLFHTALSESKRNRTLEMRWHRVLCI